MMATMSLFPGHARSYIFSHPYFSPRGLIQYALIHYCSPMRVSLESLHAVLKPWTSFIEYREHPNQGYQPIIIKRIKFTIRLDLLRTDKEPIGGHSSPLC